MTLPFEGIRVLDLAEALERAPHMVTELDQPGIADLGYSDEEIAALLASGAAA